MKKITKAELKKRNAEFNALTPLKKRVAVAKDVLLQLKTGAFIAGDGYGCPTEEHEDTSTYSYFPLGNLQLAVVGGIKCVGCAKAACIVSKAKLGNDVVVTRNIFSEELADDVSYSIFGKYCADIIEVVYEDNEIRLPSEFPSGEEFAALRKYRKSLPDREEHPTERMRAIYQNIITNRGHFVVGDYKY